MRTIQEKDLKELEEVMPANKVRPSVLSPLGQIFGLASAASTVVLGKHYTNLLLYSVEKGI
jgi:demethoxyubiquinone hydroxylase (CLK1/Coq7/Cat5 family)